MKSAKKRPIKSNPPFVSAPTVSALEHARRTLQASINELTSTVSTLESLINKVENDNQERMRLTKSGTLVL